MKNQTRRNFLKTSMLGGAGALVLPGLLPSCLCAAETKPNDRLTMGFIGMGTQSRFLLQGFLGLNTQVLAVCDVDTTRREHAGNMVDTHYSNSECQAYEDFREIMARKDIDAVCIATPDHWHAIITLAALRSGKDVYCEKPLTHNIHEAIEVMKAVQANHRVLQTGSMQRSTSEFRVACELVRNGVIGQVKTVKCIFGPPPVPCDLGEEPMEPGLNWDRWLGPAPMRPYNSILSPRGVHSHFPAWRNYQEFGGGMITDWGAHHLDIAQWGLGMDDSGPVEVLPPSNAGDKSGATLVYANGITVKHVAGHPLVVNSVDFVGSSGRVQVTRDLFSFERDGKIIARYRGKEDEDTNLTQQLRRAQDLGLKDAKVRLYTSQNHLADFLACVKSRKKPITNEQVGGRTAICCHLMNLAYLHHQKIKWNPAKLAFTKGSGDPKWLTRDYRTPWRV
jgi:predicted dehydrogenase